MDAKLAVDGVFGALGKPIPQPTPPEERVPPAAKGKKAKEAKKGAAFGTFEATEAICEPSGRHAVKQIQVQSSFSAAFAWRAFSLRSLFGSPCRETTTYTNVQVYVGIELSMKGSRLYKKSSGVSCSTPVGHSCLPQTSKKTTRDSDGA